MQRWDANTMQTIGRKLFDKIHKRKKHSHHNHEIHFMARDRNWLPEGIQSLVDGTYEPRCLKRYYFSDEMVDQLHISDRVFQHILLRILKPTFKHVMNPNCYHLDGPTGVKNATQKIREVLQHSRPKYFIRADIKSFYKSIPHHKLIQDVQKYYADPKLIVMLKNIIKNPIDSPYGYKNPDFGIALRGPLSQFFSGIYLKPLDDAFNQADVTYLRFQDDVLLLCKTKRQLNRCKRRMMNVLQERQLRLSKRKTRIGEIESGFHFLGIAYPPTQTVDNTSIAPVDNGAVINAKPRNVNIEGGYSLLQNQSDGVLRMVPHPRTLRKARESVKWMVADGVSRPKIKRYLIRWLCWWVNSSGIWEHAELKAQYIGSCRDPGAADFAAQALRQYRITELHSDVRQTTARVTALELAA